jgi:predicted permease
VAIRGTLGAGRRRILIQLLTESGLLSLLGGVAGVILSFWTVDLIKAIMPADVPRAQGIEVDSGVLIFALALTVITGLLFGLVPAFASAWTEISTTLREGSGTVTATKKRNRRLRMLATAQIAVAFLLTNGAILLYTSYREIHDIPFAFDTENVITGRIALQGERYEGDEKKLLLWEQLLERVKALPGVEQAAVSSKLPLEGGNNQSMLVEGQSYDPQTSRRLVERSWITPDYFDAMGIPLLAGRIFEADEGTKEERIVVINQAFVDRYYADKEPLGQVIRPNSAEPEWTATVVGVVASVPQWGPINRALPEVYGPQRLNIHSDPFLVIRTKRSPASVIPAVREAIREIDADLPMSEPRTMGQVLSDATGGRRFLMRLISMFAVIALVLAMAGIFGTMSHNVAQRTREIGVRAAFGAHNRRILALVLRDGLFLDLVGIGVGVGLLGLFYVVLRSQLYGVGGLNLLYLGVAVALVVLVTVVGSALPALRASRIDPMQALRVE